MRLRNKKIFLSISFLFIIQLLSISTVSGYSNYDTYVINYNETAGEDAKIELGPVGKADINITAVKGNVSLVMIDEENYKKWENGESYEVLNSIDTSKTLLLENESVAWRESEQGMGKIYLIIKHNNTQVDAPSFCKVVYSVVIIPFFWNIIMYLAIIIIACVAVFYLLKSKGKIDTRYYLHVLKIHDNYRYGFILSLIGEAIIIIQGVLYYTVDGINQNIQSYVPLIEIALFIVVEFNLMYKDRFLRIGFIRFFDYLFYYIATCLSLYIGGGWIIGVILALGGGLLRHSAHDQPHAKAISQSNKSGFTGENITPVTWSRNLKVGVLLTLVMSLTVSPFIPKILYGASVDNDPTISLGDTPNYNNTLYITPIFEQVKDFPEELDAINELLGPSGDYVKVGFSLSCWYSSSLNNTKNITTGIYDFNPTNLYIKLQSAVDYNIPILFHMNGGNWGASANNNNLNTELRSNKTNMQWDQFNNIPAYRNEGGLDDLLFSISPRTQFNYMREIHIKQAGNIIYNWSLSYPDLFIGLSTDSEIHMDHGKNDTEGSEHYEEELYYDYNPLVIEEYQWWLEDKYTTIVAYNTEFGESASTFSNVDAPRNKNNERLWEEWTLFRQYVIQQGVELQCKYLSECGFAREKIFGHQILSEPINQKDDESAYYERCDPRETAINQYSVGGWTKYGFMAPHTLKEVNKFFGNHWGLFEWNLWGEYSYEQTMIQLKLMYKYGIHVLCPNGWLETTNAGLFIKYNDVFLKAIKDFIAEVKDVPRGLAEIGELTISEYNYLFIESTVDYIDDHFLVLLCPLLGSLSILILIKIFKKKKFIASSR